MKSKLNLKDHTADWCCESHPELIKWASERDEIEYNGNLDYYGQFSGKINGGNKQFGTEYTPAEFAEALAELTAPEWQPKWGDEIEVSDDGVKWKPMQFIAIHPITNAKHSIVVACGFSVHVYAYMRKPRPTITVTIDGIAKPITDFTEAQLIELYKSATI